MLVRGERQVFPALQRDLVAELHQLGIESPGELDNARALGQVFLHGAGHGLRKRELEKQARQVGERGVEGQAARAHLVGDCRGARRMARGHSLQQPQQKCLVDGAEHLAHAGSRNPAPAVRDGLVEERQRVAHASGCRAPDQRQRFALKLNLLLTEQFFKVGGNRIPRHLLQVELQAAAEHRDRDLLRVGRGEDELEVLRRLFKRFQHRVERVPRELVHLVDHVHLEPPGRRRIRRALEQLGHLIDAAVRRRIQLDVVRKPAGIDLHASAALVAGLRRDPRFAIQALG